MTDPTIAARFQPYLAGQEIVRWTGCPKNGFLLTPDDMFLIPFSMMWGGGVLFWETSVLRQGAPGFFALWGAPFVLMGLYMILGRFFHDAWIRRRTFYALTSSRALVLQSGSLRSLPLGGGVHLSSVRGTRGTLQFGSKSQFLSIFKRRTLRESFELWLPALRSEGVCFLQATDIQTAYKLAT